MANGIRVNCLMTPKQYSKLVKIGADHDRSLSWLIGNAITTYLGEVSPAANVKGTVKHMCRTSADNAEAVKRLAPDGWRYVNACVQRLIDAYEGQSHGTHHTG